MKERKRKWTYGAIKQEASLYKSCSEWCKLSRSSYNAAINMGVVRQISQELGRKTRSIITKEEVLQLAKTVKNATEFDKLYHSYYSNARRNGFLNELVYGG